MGKRDITSFRAFVEEPSGNARMLLWARITRRIKGNKVDGGITGNKREPGNLFRGESDHWLIVIILITRHITPQEGLIQSLPSDSRPNAEPAVCHIGDMSAPDEKYYLFSYPPVLFGELYPSLTTRQLCVLTTGGKLENCKRRIDSIHTQHFMKILIKCIEF